MTSCELNSDGRIEVETDLGHLLELIPGAKRKVTGWNLQAQSWTVPLSRATLVQLTRTFDDIKLSEELQEWWNQEQKDVAACLELRDALTNENDEYPDLFPYQVAGAVFLSTAGQAILGDPPGSGKTCQATTAARMLGDKALPAVVVAPKSTLLNWQREIERWWPGVPVFVAQGTKKQRGEAILNAGKHNGFCIINWESARLHTRLARYGSTALSEEERTPKELNQVEWKLVIADEAHKLSDPKSKQTRAVWQVGHETSVNYRWGLTATPLTDDIDTAYPLLRFITPNEHPSKVQFIDRYAILRTVPWGSGTEVVGMNPEKEDEFQDIFRPRFRRMPKEIILPQLPPIVRTMRELEMSPEQARLYREMSEAMVAETDTGEMIIAQNPGSKLFRLVQFSSAAADLMPTDDGEFRARLKDPSNKLDALMDDLPPLLLAGESVVVFAQSRQLIEMAEARLTKAKIHHGVIKGNQKPEFRQAQIDGFQSGKIPVMLVVISAGGVGINLNRARIGIFLQRSWSFVENHQAEGRIHRIGSEVHESVQYIDYASVGTADFTVCQTAEGKEITLERVIRDRDTVKKLIKGELKL